MDQAVLNTVIVSGTALAVSTVWAFVAHKVAGLKWAKAVEADIAKADPGLKVTESEVETLVTNAVRGLLGKVVEPAPAAPATVAEPAPAEVVPAAVPPAHS
jgi:hypothetical protein